MIIIIDYGMGNVGSIKNMLNKIGADCKVSRESIDIINADKLILPGVGSYDQGMDSLVKYGLIDLLNEAVIKQKKPILGICLGMQMLCLGSEEGIRKGLGFIPLYVKKFEDFTNSNHKIPHMGWRYVKKDIDSPLTRNSEINSRYYFVHSYYVPFSKAYSVLSCNYITEFSAAFQMKNIYGTQFHPEKSNKYGMQLLKNFVEDV